MPDITMCTGTDCGIRFTCYRHRAIPHEYRQSYFTKPPFHTEFDCEYYWPLKYAESDVDSHTLPAHFDSHGDDDGC